MPEALAAFTERRAPVFTSKGGNAVVTLGDIDPGFGPGDDGRHWPATAGGRMRDSLFWELIMPEEQLGLQI